MTCFRPMNSMVTYRNGIKELSVPWQWTVTCNDEWCVYQNAFVSLADVELALPLLRRWKKGKIIDSEGLEAAVFVRSRI